nr:reverse transcriptase domain-containing protein [Tanacetum cinerariifolium]
NPSSNPTPSTNPNPKGRNRRRSKQRIEEFNLEELSPPTVMMADQCNMAQLLQAPTEGYEDAIVIPSITADNFELKHDQDSLNSAAGGNFLDKMPRECLAIIQSKSKVCYSRNKPVVAKVSMNTSTSSISPDVAELKDMVKALLLEEKSKPSSYYCESSRGKFASTSSSGTLPSNTIANPRSDLKAITTQSVNSPIIEPVASSVSAPRHNQRPLIPYLSRLQDQKLRDKANEQREKFFQIFKDLNFNISFVDALILMSKFGPSIKSLLTNKDKLYELARTPLNEHCSAVLLKNTSINLMPLFVWNKLFLPDLSPTCMTLELADRSISRPVEVEKDVYVKVGTFHFSADFVVVDFDADPRVPLILRRFFLKTRRALINVFEGELTIRVGKEAITFNLDQTLRYSANYNDTTAKRIDVIDMACEEYSQEVLGFSDVIASGNPTPYFDPIVSTISLTLTPFKNSDFLLEEVDAFLALEDNPTSPEVDQSYLDSEGDILLLEAFLNDDPSLPPPNQGNYLPKVRKELKICKAKSDKSSIDEPQRLNSKTYLPISNTHFWKGIDLEFCTHKILMEEDFKPVFQHQRRVNPRIHDVIKQEVLKLLDAGLIYPISDSPWVSPVHCVPKKGGFTVVENKDNEFRLVWSRVGVSASTIEKTTFTCPYETFAYHRMPFGLYNAPGMFQRCMMAIFHDMIKKTMEVFMDDFSVFENSFQSCVSHLERMLKRRSKHPFILEESPIDTMAGQRTMAELLRAPTEGYAEAIVVLQILAEQFELKHSLINMMTSDQFFGLEKDNPHDHIRAARQWLEKEPPRSIHTWEDLVSKFIN